MKKTYIGGITKTYDTPTRYGFNISFEDKKTTNEIKQKLIKFLECDNFQIIKNNAMYDMERY